MRYSCFLPSLTGVLAAVAAVVVAQSPQPAPIFEPLFVGKLVNGDPENSLNTTGPFGTRLYSPVTE